MSGFELLPDSPADVIGYDLLKPEEHDMGGLGIKQTLHNHLSYTANLLAEFDEPTRGRWIAELAFLLAEDSHVDWLFKAIADYCDE